MGKNEIIVPGLNNETIEFMIYIIRGQKEMLGFELAKIYGYDAKNFNQQVKNNINKFPERYRFQLNKDELNFVMSKKSTSQKNFFSGQNGGTRKLPYAFTEKGMLDLEPAKIYGYSTKAFNEQVKNNINKFLERYRFQLSK